MKLIYPPRFSFGDTIGIVAPASPPNQPEKIEEAIQRLIAQGFRVKMGEHAREKNGYLAGTDEERAADLHALFREPDVRAILAMRGGYGSCRILPLLDYDLIRANPKPFIGYSDITTLHHALLTKAGLSVFHGPNLREAFLPGNARCFHQLFLEPLEQKELSLFSRGEDSEIKTLVPGKATGRLLGGNMTCLLRLLSTPYAPDFKGAILFLEDIGEKAYRIDGMFTHLRLAGITRQIAGIILGRFSHDEAEECVRIKGCLQREAEHIGVPCVSGAPIGHFEDQIIVPLGLEAMLDANAGLLTTSLR